MIYVEYGHGTDRGSFAVVVPALEVDDETAVCRQVAVKRVRPRSEFPSGKQYDRLHEQAIRLFERERKVWCTLASHPGVVQALKASRIDGDPVLLLEYIYGATLEETLTGPAGPLHPVDLVDLLDQISSALRHLHEVSRLAHGDVSTQNLLYDGEGLIRLSDLGLAAPIGADLTFTDLQPALRAPEQKDAAHVTPAMDVWKAGVCFLLAARGESLSSFLARRPDLSRLRSCNAVIEESVRQAMGDIDDGEFESSLRHLLREALAPNPARRLRHGGELADAVRELRNVNGRWNMLLERRRETRRRLRFWRCNSPRTAKEALGVLKSFYAELLSADYTSPAHRLLPESPYLLAVASWISSGGNAAHTELLEMAHSFAQTSVNAFDGDPRPLEIMVLAAEARGEAADARDLNLRAERNLVRLFSKFGTFVRAHQVRKLEDLLVNMKHRSEHAEMLLHEARGALAAFDERFLQHYKNLEAHLLDVPF